MNPFMTWLDALEHASMPPPQIREKTGGQETATASGGAGETA